MGLRALLQRHPGLQEPHPVPDLLVQPEQEWADENQEDT